MTKVSSTTARTSPIPLSRRRWTTLVFLCCAQLMLILDLTVVNVALPTIGDDLGLSTEMLLWVVAGYSLVFGGLLLVGGRLADGLEARRMFEIGLAVFVLASFSSAISTSGASLVISRLSQGLGAALLSPAALSMVMAMFEGEQRRRALAVWAAVGGAGSALGLFLGGALTTWLDWRWIFYINVPIGLLVFAGVARLTTRQSKPRVFRFDLWGAVTSAVGLGLIIFGLIRAGSAGWSAASTFGPIVFGLLISAIFVMIEHRSTHPLLSLALFHQRAFAGGTLGMLGGMVILSGTFLLASLYFQMQLSMTALQTGLAILPVAPSIVVGAHLAQHVIARAGMRRSGVLGFSVMTLGIVYSVFSIGGEHIYNLLPGIMLVGVGGGMAFVVCTSSALTSVDNQETGVASAVVSAAHELGVAMGVAAIAVVTGAGAGAVTDLASTDSLRVAFIGLGAVALTTVALTTSLLPVGRPPRDQETIFVH